MNYVLESQTKEHTFEERVILNLPYFARCNTKLNFNQRLVNTFYFIVAYVILSNIPLFAIQPVSVVSKFRFTLTGFKSLNILSVAKICSFATSLIVTFLIKQEVLVITAGKRRADIIRAKFKFGMYLLLAIVAAVVKTREIFSLDSVGILVYPDWGFWFKILTFLQFIAGAVAYFFLQEQADSRGLGSSMRVMHLVDYGQMLLEWFQYARYTELESGFTGLQVFLFSACFIFSLCWLYTKSYVIPLQSTHGRGLRYEHEVKYMFCDTQAVYLSSLTKEFASKIIYFFERFLKIPCSAGLKEFINSDSSYHYNYLFNKNWLTVADLLYNGFCYVILAYVWAIFTDSGVRALSSELSNARYYVVGYRKDAESLQKALRPGIDVLNISSSVLTFLIISIGNILPLFGNINAQNLLVLATLVIELRKQIQTDHTTLRKTGEKIHPFILSAFCISE